MPARASLIGHPPGEFGRLTVVGRVTETGRKGAWWLCRCDCGTLVMASTGNLQRARRPARSCGCLRSEAAARKQAVIREHPEARTCPHCGTTFGALPWQAFCSRRCYRADRYRSRR